MKQITKNYKHKRSLYNAVNLAIFTSILFTNTAHSTNGIFLPGYGAKQIAMAGTSIAVPHDALDPSSNPANISWQGTRLDVGVGIFNPPRRTFVDARGSFFGDNIGESRSSRDWFLVPNFGYTYSATDKWTFGITGYGNGLGISYGNNIYDFNGASSSPLRLDLMQMLLPLTAAYKVDNSFSLAASLVLGAQMFSAQGFQSFSTVSRDINALTDNGKDFAFGAGVRLGFTKKFYNDAFAVGGYYASETYFSKFDDYAGLIPEQGKLNIPEHFGLGLAYNFTPDLLFAFDIVRINWSSTRAFGNKGPELFTGVPLGQAASGGEGQIGADDGMSFGWEDRTVYKIGTRYGYNATSTISAGINYAKTPIPQDQLAFGVIGPATTEWHLSIGWNKKLDGFTIFGGEQADFTISFLHAYKNKMAGLSPLGTNQVTGQEFAGYAEFEMYQNQLEISYGLQF